jgi:phage-related protein
MDKNLWEVRIRLENRIARILFTVTQDGMVLLYGFIKKSNHTPQDDLGLAKRRLKQLEE